MSADPATSATPSAIDVEHLDDGAIVILTINRTHRRNALDSQTLAELHRLLDILNGDPAARAVVLTGAGSAFCSGADIKAQPGDLIDATATPHTALQAAATSTVAITFAAQELMASAFEKMHRLRQPSPATSGSRYRVQPSAPYSSDMASQHATWAPVITCHAL
jgi:enoyl-CoA hydratase/carnithine racemase